MALFNLDVDLREKPKSVHPWQKRIKECFVPLVKYAHSSVHSNYKYPIENKPNYSTLRFSVTGNMFAKEFIYCVNIVQGLHKYRNKIYSPPHINGKFYFVF